MQSTPEARQCHMDEVAIWSKELSAAEVAASYNGGAGADLTNGIPDDD